MTSVNAITQQRPLRADAARNRLLIIDAARELFADRGLDVTLDDVAAHAGVGVGTVYRRFASKDELIDSVFQQNFEDLAAAADRGLADPDTWTGLTGFMEFACGRMAMNRGMAEMVNRFDGGCQHVADQRARIEPKVETLVVRAQRAGTLRPDVVATDLYSMVFMVASAAEFAQPVNPDVWPRYLALFLDGIRGDAPDGTGRHPRTVLPVRGLTEEELHEARQSCLRSRR